MKVRLHGLCLFVTALTWFGHGVAIAQPGPSYDALPGAWRVGAADLGGQARLTLAGLGGYGLIPGIEGEGGDHHRAIGTAALGVVPLEHLAFSAGLSGLWDAHPDDAGGADGSGLGAFFVTVRGAYRWPSGLALGVDARWDASGGDAPDLVLEASRLSLRALGSLRIDEASLTLLVHAGYRFDGSARTVDALDRYRRGDRISLGASTSDAVLVGLGASWRAEPLELFVEGTFEPYVGSDAPDLDTSPIRVAAGARIEATDGVRAHLALEVTAQRRPQLVQGEPLVPSEPRLAVFAGISWTPSLGGAPGAEESVEEDATHEAPPPRSAIAGEVRSPDGVPVIDAEVELLAEGIEEPQGQTRTDAQGAYRFADLAPGTYRVRIRADGFQPVEHTIDVEEGAAAPIMTSTLSATESIGAIRGLVRDFAGRALRARIIIEPGGHTASTDEDGVFELSVPPGAYEVRIHASGHASQRRSVRVSENGVTILNADLRRESR